MKNLNFYLSIIYLLLGLANILGWVKFEDGIIFGMTSSALFLGIAPLFKSQLIKNLFYIFSLGLLIIFPVLVNANEMVKDFDGNTWMLLALSVTFLSNYINKVNSDKISVQEKDKELMNKIKRLNEQNTGDGK